MVVVPITGPRVGLVALVGVLGSGVVWVVPVAFTVDAPRGFRNGPKWWYFLLRVCPPKMR